MGVVCRRMRLCVLANAGYGLRQEGAVITGMKFEQPYGGLRDHGGLRDMLSSTI